jgi:hypothetical protein
MYVATYLIILRLIRRVIARVQIDNTVRLYSTTSGQQTQLLPHRRPVTDLSWRLSEASNRFVLNDPQRMPSHRTYSDDLILYTITADSVVRIFFPVLDSPQHLQLHASIDLRSSISYPVANPKDNLTSTVFWMDRQVINHSLQQILAQKLAEDNASLRRLQDVKDEGWDLFLRVVSDGTVVISAVAVSSSLSLSKQFSHRSE